MADERQPMYTKIGVLGAGQLGKMLADSGQPLGKQFGFYTSSRQVPAAQIDGPLFLADDPGALTSLLAFADVVTYESENTEMAMVQDIASSVPVYPSKQALFVAQHRGREKALFEQLNIPCAPYQIVGSLETLKDAVETIGLPAILKTTTEGYDGKGQFVIKEASQVEQAWADIGGRELILEGFVDFQRELSIIAVRNANNEFAYYPLVQNVHHEGILRYTIAPARKITETVQEEAQGYIHRLLEELDYVGVLTLELFDTLDGLVANEMAPRVHNSGHWTQDGAVTDQFENHVRAITGMSLGDPSPRYPISAMINIIGHAGPIDKVAEMPGAFLHWYNKEARPNRKLGHINLVADSEKSLYESFQLLADFLPKS